MNWLGNPILEFVLNIGVALLGIFLSSIISVVLYHKQQSRKGITYKVTSDTPLLSLKEEVKGKVRVLVGTHSVSNARLIILKIWNSGNIPILPDEHVDPISFLFGAGVEILDAEILESVPRSIKNKTGVSLKIEKEKVILEPNLLNRGDFLTLKVLLAQDPTTKEIKVETHIVGLDYITNYYGPDAILRPFSRIFTLLSYIIFLYIVFYLILSIYVAVYSTKILLLLIFSGCALGYIIVFMAFASLVHTFAYKETYPSSLKFMIKKFMGLVRFMLREEKE